MGIGAAPIINIRTVNNAVLGKIEMYATGDVEIRTIMEEIEETTLDEEGKRQATKMLNIITEWQPRRVPEVPYSALQGLWP